MEITNISDVKQQIQIILQKHNITLDGFTDNVDDNILSDVHLQNIIQCMSEIPLIIKPVKSYNLGSYYGKHVIEKFRKTNNYISNGEFIIAMMLVGYKCKKNGLNGVFKASKIENKLFI